MYKWMYNLRKNERGEANVMQWTTLIIGVVILFIIVAALMPTFLDALTDYDNATTDPIATVVPTLGPILLSVALLLLLVFTLLRQSRA